MKPTDICKHCGHERGEHGTEQTCYHINKGWGSSHYCLCPKFVEAPTDEAS